MLLTPDKLDIWATVAPKHLGEQAVTVLVPDSGPREVTLVRPDAHLGWHGASIPDVLDRWLNGILGQ